MNRYLLALGAAALIACGSSTRSASGGGGSGGSVTSVGDGGSNGEAPVACVPGQQIACACVGGARSAQACNSDGSGYLACACAPGNAHANADGATETSDAGGGASGESAGGSAGTSRTDADAAAGGESAGDTGTSTPDAGGASGCSTDAVIATTDQAIATLRARFASATTFCLQELTHTDQASGSTVSVCTTPACANTPNTCAASFGSPTFNFGSTVNAALIDPNESPIGTSADTAFTATGDITVTGAASATVVILTQSCSDLQLSAPATAISGTLRATYEPSVDSTSVRYTLVNVAAHANSIGVAGCGAIGAVLNLVAGLEKAPIEQSATNLLSQQSFDISCAGASSSSQ